MIEIKKRRDISQEPEMVRLKELYEHMPGTERDLTKKRREDKINKQEDSCPSISG